MTDDELAEVAAQLVGRVRDDDPEANARWLTTMVPEPRDWFRLAFVLAIAVPDDVTWSALTDWVRRPPRKLAPHGTASAAGRHRYHGEPLCAPCKSWDRERKRLARHPVDISCAQPVDNSRQGGEAA